MGRTARHLVVGVPSVDTAATSLQLPYELGRVGTARQPGRQADPNADARGAGGDVGGTEQFRALGEVFRTAMEGMRHDIVRSFEVGDTIIVEAIFLGPAHRADGYPGRHHPAQRQRGLLPLRRLPPGPRRLLTATQFCTRRRRRRCGCGSSCDARAGVMISGTASGRESRPSRRVAATHKQLPRRFRSSTLRVCGAGRLASTRSSSPGVMGRVSHLSVVSGPSLVWPIVCRLMSLVHRKLGTPKVSVRSILLSVQLR